MDDLFWYKNRLLENSMKHNCFSKKRKCKIIYNKKITPYENSINDITKSFDRIEQLNNLIKKYKNLKEVY